MGFDGAGLRPGARLAQPAERAVCAARVGRAVSREPARRRACARCRWTHTTEQQRGRLEAAITKEGFAGSSPRPDDACIKWLTRHQAQARYIRGDKDLMKQASNNTGVVRYARIAV